MMVNLLVANKNTTELDVLVQNLANDKKYNIEHTFSENDTIYKYSKINPDILLLDDSLSEKTIENIINRLSIFQLDRKKCNTILTLENGNFIRLEKFSKIYSIFYKPFENNLLYNAITDLSDFYYTPDIKPYDVDTLLASLSFNCFSNGYKYLEEAIIYCYYNQDALEKFDTILEIVGYKHCISKEQVRDAIRACLKSYNSVSHNYFSKDLEMLLYNDGNNITPKQFLQRIVIYLSHIKKKEKD